MITVELLSGKGSVRTVVGSIEFEGPSHKCHPTSHLSLEQLEVFAPGIQKELSFNKVIGQVGEYEWCA